MKRIYLIKRMLLSWFCKLEECMSWHYLHFCILGRPFTHSVHVFVLAACSLAVLKIHTFAFFPKSNCLGTRLYSLSAILNTAALVSKQLRAHSCVILSGTPFSNKHRTHY